MPLPSHVIYGIIGVLLALYIRYAQGSRALRTHGSSRAHKLYDLYERRMPPSNFHLIYARICVCFLRDRGNMEFYSKKIFL